jgi:hypothetical protein
MHRVEIRLSHEGNDPSANFEVHTETLKDGNYVELAPMRTVASDLAPMIMFLDPNERVVVVAKANTGRLVYDKEQNANIRVETEAEIEARKQREANLAKSTADQELRAAQGNASDAKVASENAERAANTEVRKAEANVAQVKTEQASQPPQAGSVPKKNEAPIDSKQVKKDG